MAAIISKSLFLWVAILLNRTVLQDGVEEADIRTWIAKLGSHIIDERIEAEKHLRTLPPRDVERLKHILARESDLEVRGRIKLVIAEILRKEAQTLYQLGDLQGSLLKFAEAEGAIDCSRYVKEGIEKVRKSIQSWFPGEDAAVQVFFNYKAMAKKLKETSGPWGMAALLEELALSEEQTPVHAVQIAEEMGEEVVPFLTQALGKSDAVLVSHACSALHGMLSQRVLKSSPQLIAALEKLVGNNAIENHVKEKARTIMVALTEAAEKKATRRK